MAKTKRKIVFIPRKYRTTQLRTRKLLFVDLEFSGLNFDHEVIEIAGILVEPKNLKILKEWAAKVKPKRIKLADKEALRLVGYSKEGWKDAVDLKTALRKFNSLAKDAVLVGYNISWDFLFLFKSYWQENVKIKFHYQVLDVLPMAYSKLRKKRSVNNFTLREAAKFLGVEMGKHHRALDDARTTYEIFKKLMKL